MAEIRDRRNFTREEAQEFLSYDIETGEFTWLVTKNSHGGKIYPGRRAGGLKDGYIQIKLYGRYYRAHHLAWLFSTGEWPDPSLDVDHINRIRSDNRWQNLRYARRCQNNMNSAPRSDNKSGCKGVTLVKKTGKWDARIKFNGELRLLGVFSDLQDAIDARKSAERKLYGEFSVQ